MNFAKIFTDRLNNLITANHLSKQSLANEIGVKRQAVSQFANGTSLPSVSTLISIADYFCVSLDYLTGRSDDFHIKNFLLESNKRTGGLKVKEYQELSREIIREYGDNLLVKVTGLYLEQYRTTFFERWTSRAAYDRRQKADGNRIFCMNLAETEETVLADWNKFIADRQSQYKDVPKYTCAECGHVSTNEFLDRCSLCGGQIPNHD